MIKHAFYIIFSLSLVSMLVPWMSVVMADDTTVYKRYDEEGAVEFSDVKRKESEEVKVQEMPTYKSPKYKPITPRPAESEDTKKQKTSYKISISSPKQDSAIYENSGQVTISVDIKPPLKNHHRIVFNLDGKKSKPVSTTSYTFSDVSRGQHTVGASLSDTKGKVFQSAKNVTFQLHRHSVLHPKTKAPGGAK